MTLGPVSKYIADQVKFTAQRNGPLVWLDSHGHFSALAASLKQAHDEGEFTYPVVSFQGSFLEIMLDLKPHGGGLHKSGLIIHMPGFHRENIRTTPMLEQYRAGTRYEIALDTSIRQAATGLVTPTAIDAFLNGPNATLESADAWLARAAIVVHSELGAWLEQVPPVLVLTALTSRNHLQHDELTKPSSRTLVEGWFEKRLGVGQSWRRFAARVRGPVEEHKSDAHLPVLTHALAVEYVHDLSRAPVVEALVELKDLQPALVKENQKIAAWLRKEHPDRYERIADELEGLLGEQEKDSNPEDLGQIDTFRFEEAKLMKGALDALKDEEWGKALNWAEGRKAQASFWSSRQPQRRSAWKLIAAAAKLGSAIASGHELLETRWLNQAEALDVYARRERFGAWQVDHAHRVLESERARRWNAQLPHYSELQERLADLRVYYRRWADDLGREYARVCRDSGFLPDPNSQQRTLFTQVVRPLLQDHPRQSTAYFMVDAMRYELGAELFKRLENLSGFDVTLTPRFAEAPTLTCIGMNALAGATNAAGRLTLTVNAKGNPTGLHKGEYAINKPDSRRRAMRDGAGLANCNGLSLAEVLIETPSSLKSRVAQTRLFVVHSLEIDEAGEHGTGLHVFDRYIDQLESAIHLLREAGIHHFVLTADHGFLLQDDSTLNREGFGTRRTPKRRYAMHSAPNTAPNHVNFSALQLGLEGTDRHFVFLTGTHVFDRGNQKDGFVHGGISLQERVIPVIRLEQKRRSGSTTLQYSVTTQPMQQIHDMCRVKGTLEIASSGVLSFGGDQSLTLALRAVSQDDVEIQILQVDDANQVGGTFIATASTTFSVFLKLVGARDGRVQLQLYHPGSHDRMPPYTLDGWFPVLQRPNTAPPPPVVAPTPDAEPKWLDTFDDDGVRQVFAFLDKHGSINEAEATRMLGGPRKFRRFSSKFDTLKSKAPFEITTEHADSGKRYVRDDT